jgi:group I intron endonuclease
MINQAGIYKLVNKFNQKIYIGKSINLYKRIQRHAYSENRKNNNQVIDRAIKKYKWKNFDIEILHISEAISNVELLALEVAFINFYNSTNKRKGYNILMFAFDRTGIKHSQKTKKKIAKYKPNLGKKFTLAHRKNISLSKKGDKHPNWQKKHKTVTIAKMKLARKTRPFTYKKPIKQINLITGETIKIWPSAVDAAYSLNLKSKYASSGINKVCRGIKKKMYNFRWEFV